MKVRLAIAFLSLFICIGTLKAQMVMGEMSKRKYDGNWYIGPARRPSFDSIIYSQIIIDSTERFKWLTVCVCFIRDTTSHNGRMSCFLFPTYRDTCYDDSSNNLSYETCQLSGLKYDENILFEIERYPELSTLYHSNIDRTIDIFKFQTTCEKGNPSIELLFFTKTKGLAIYHYPSSDKVVYLRKDTSH